MWRRLLIALLLLSLAAGGRAECCLPAAPQAATAGAMEADADARASADTGGCHGHAGEAPAEPSPADSAASCASCLHCLGSVVFGFELWAAAPLPPQALAAPRPLPSGLPAYAPPLRPPIAATAQPLVQSA